MINEVAVVQVKNEKDLRKSVEEAIDLIGGFYPREGSRIVIKPNLCISGKSSESGVTTDVRVVEALIKYILKHCTSHCIIIAEGDSQVASADYAFKRLGYAELADAYSNVELHNLSKDDLVKVVPPTIEKTQVLELPETLLFMDYFISVAKLKRHSSERVTCIWKNQYGCIPRPDVRLSLHPFLSEVLFDLNNLISPDLSVVDGMVGLEGTGPINGVPKNVGKIICGKNPLSVDVVATEIMGDSPDRVPHLSYALKRDLTDARTIEVLTNGEKVKAVHPFKFISGFQYNVGRMGLRLRKVGMYLGNIGYLLAIISFALREQSLSPLIQGRLLPIMNMLQIAKDTLFKPEVGKRIV